MPSANDAWVFLTIGDNYTQTFEYDANGSVIYQGLAAPGSSQSASVWRIKKFTYNGANQVTDITWPNSSPAFAFAWASRTSYTYA